MEEIIRKKDSDIHIRCYKEDKEYVNKRAKDGFGKEKNSITNFILYAIRHVDDASPIDLMEADELIRAIGENRQTLAAVHEDINSIPQELNAFGNNLNQIAKSINTIMKIAREDGEDLKETVGKIAAFERTIIAMFEEVVLKIESYNDTVLQARIKINNILRKEDEILTRCLVFPAVGENIKRKE